MTTQDEEMELLSRIGQTVPRSGALVCGPPDPLAEAQRALDALAEQRRAEGAPVGRREFAALERRQRALEYAFTHSRHDASQSDRERRLAWCLAYEEELDATPTPPDEESLAAMREYLPKAVPPAWSPKSRAAHLASPPSAHAKEVAFHGYWQPDTAARIVRALENVTWADLGVTQETTDG